MFIVIITTLNIRKIYGQMFQSESVMPRLKHRPSTWTLLSNYKCCPSIGFACSTSVLIKFTFESYTSGVIHIVKLTQEECQISPDFMYGSVELHELHKCCCLAVILSNLWINLILPLNNIPSVLYGHNPHTLTAMAVGLGGYNLFSSLFIYSSQALSSGLFGFRSSLQRRQNEYGDVSNHRRIDCLLNHLFRRRSKKNINAPRHGPLWGEFTGDHLMTSSWRIFSCVFVHVTCTCATSAWKVTKC